MAAKNYKVLCFLSMAAFVISLPLSVAEINDKPLSGWDCLTGLYTEWFWAANPIVLVAWISILRRSQMSILWASAAMVCGIGAAVLYAQNFPISTLRAGYWIWLTSFLFAALASLDLLHQERPFPREIQ